MLTKLIEKNLNINTNMVKRFVAIPVAVMIMALPGIVTGQEVSSSEAVQGVSSTDDSVKPDKKQADKEKCKMKLRKPILGSMYMMGGVSFADTDALNGRFENNGYSKIDSPAGNLGVGMTHRFGRFVTGVDFNWLLTSNVESSNPDTRMDMKSWFWQVTYGFDVVQFKGLSVYPLVGIGMGHSQIHISSETGDSFNNVLQNPNLEVYMRQNSLLLSAGAGVDYRFKMRENERKTSYFTIGVRGSYIFQPYAGEWKTKAATINGGPEKGLQGPQVLLIIGISGERHHK